MMLKYYILSLKWSKGDNVKWWGPNNNDYTSFLENAGLYTEDQILAEPDYYNNGESTLAVPVIFADGFKKTIVPIDKIENMKQISEEYVGRQLLNKDN